MDIATTNLMLRYVIGNLRYQRVKYIVEYLLKAKTVEPEKQQLLSNDSTRPIPRQRLAKHVPAETNNATVWL
jgi:hypothetical protein